MAENKCITRDYALPFAAWELRLYLNSHPQDRCALRLYHQLMESMGCFTYAHTGLEYPACQGESTETVLERMDGAACPGWGNLDELTDGGCACHTGDQCPIHWSWVDDPWPWDGGCPHCAQ